VTCGVSTRGAWHFIRRPQPLMSGQCGAWRGGVRHVTRGAYNSSGPQPNTRLCAAWRLDHHNNLDRARTMRRPWRVACGARRVACGACGVCGVVMASLFITTTLTCRGHRTWRGAPCAYRGAPCAAVWCGETPHHTTLTHNVRRAARGGHACGVCAARHAWRVRCGGNSSVHTTLIKHQRTVRGAWRGVACAIW
jgi:hypothetical protein